MAGAGAAAIVAAMGRYQRAHAGIGAIGRSSAGVGSGFNGYYPSGHWTNSPLGSLSNTNQTASQIYPRPDTETSTYARHRWMFYDGSHVFKNIVPIIGRLGAFPWVYELITAPAAAGAAMGGTIWQPGWSIAQALAAGYGDLECTCTGTFSAGTFTVRMHDQAGNYNDFTFTSSTIAGYDATNGNGFVFLDPVGGADPGSYPSSGISNNITTPIKTSGWAFGATQGTVTYPNAILVIRGTGTLAISNQSATYGISAESGKNPMAAIGYPGEAATIDLSGAGTKEAFDLQNNTPDQFFQGITFENGPASSSQFSCFYAQPGQVQSRLTLHNLSFPNIFTGSNVVGSGASELTLDDPNSSALTPLHTYIAMKGVSETNRTRQTGDTNNTIMLTAYKSQYGCVELCSCTGTVEQNYGFRLKLGNSDWTIRENLCVSTQGFAMGTSDFTGSGGESTVPNANVEYCFDTVVGNAVATLFFNQAADATATNHYAYRCSIIGCGGVYPAASAGPFAFSNNAIQYGTAAQAITFNSGSGWVGGTLPSTITNDGTQNGNSRAQASSGVLDAATYLLTGTYRTTYLGTDGAEIA